MGSCEASRVVQDYVFHFVWEIFEELDAPFDLNVKSKDHISPHFLLAISTGLLHHQTAPKAEALLKELLSTVSLIRLFELCLFLDSRVRFSYDSQQKSQFKPQQPNENLISKTLGWLLCPHHCGWRDLFIANGSVQQRELILRKNDKWWKCSPDFQLFEYINNGGINGCKNDIWLPETNIRLQKYEKKHIIAAGELEVVQKHGLRFCLMAAAFWNIGSTISMLI